jgi:tetratricopeptide (TPR) repeat protein
MFQSVGFLGGTVFALLIMGKISHCYLSAIKTRDLQGYNQALIVGLTGSTIHSLIDFDWHYLSLFLLVFVILGVNENYVKPAGKSICSQLIMFLFTLTVIVNLSGILDMEKVVSEAVSLKNKNKIGESIIVLEQGKKIDPFNQDILRLLSSYYQVSGNYGKAHQYYQEAISKAPAGASDLVKEDILLYIREARDALNAEQLKQAIGIINYLARNYPYHNQIDGNSYFQKYNRQNPGSQTDETLQDYLRKFEEKAIKVYFESQKRL